MFHYHLMPKKIILDQEEIDRTNRVRVARYLGQLPQTVDLMPYADVVDVLAVISADARIEQYEAKKPRRKK